MWPLELKKKYLFIMPHNSNSNMIIEAELPIYLNN